MAVFRQRTAEIRQFRPEGDRLAAEHLDLGDLR